MDFNSFVFPIPSSSYTKNDFSDHLIYIPKKDYSYKDKLKYTVIQNKNIQSKDKKPLSLKSNGKLVYHNKSSSMIQKVPSVTFTIDNKFEENKKNSYENKIEHIPCLFYSPEKKSDMILLYFHSNYEDIGNSASLLKLICKHLCINVLAVEYPNYGIYSSKDSANAEMILSDAETVFKFIKNPTSSASSFLCFFALSNNISLILTISSLFAQTSL